MSLCGLRFYVKTSGLQIQIMVTKAPTACLKYNISRTLGQEGWSQQQSSTYFILFFTFYIYYILFHSKQK